MDNSDLSREIGTQSFHFPDSMWTGDNLSDKGFRPLYIERFAGPRRLEVPFGWHRFWEVTFVLSGEGALQIANEEILLKKACGLLLPPHTSHREVPVLSRWDTLWIAFERPPDPLPACHLYLPECQALLKQAELIWSWSKYQSGKIGPELSDLCSFFIRAFARLAQHTGTPETRKWLPRVIDYVDTHLGEQLTIDRLAQMADLSPGHFHRQFKLETGQTPAVYMVERRMHRAISLLIRSDLAVKDVAREVGYSDPLYFSRVFSHHFGFPPSQARTRAVQSTT